MKSLPDIHDRELLAVLEPGPGPGRYSVHSFDHRIIRRLGELTARGPPRHPALRLPRRPGGGDAGRRRDDAVAGVAAGGSRSWSPGCTMPASRIIAWTVNEIGDLERMARLGVDGLCGNYPDRIRVAIATRVAEVSRA